MEKKETKQNKNTTKENKNKQGETQQTKANEGSPRITT
jgi:hypothetical protein